MDTLSSSVSTLKISTLHSTTPREFYNFRTPNTCYHQLPPQLTTKPNSISNRTTSPNLSLKNLNSLVISTSQSLSLKSSPKVHRNPASGYAAALLDIAQCNNSLQTVQKDVQRLLKMFQNEQIKAFLANPLRDDKEKGKLLKEMAKRENFNKLLVGLLKMLIERNKVGMLNQVLMEFERICDELSGTRVVLVSSKEKMNEAELFGIAQRVQKISGALNVKVRNLVGDSFPLFAV